MDGDTAVEIAAQVHASRTTLSRLLHDNIEPFWMRGIADEVNGGYLLNHDVNGVWQGPATKYLVTQARTLWFHARMQRVEASPNKRLHAAAADAGFAFLRDRMWDPHRGGFHWAVDHAGRTAVNSEQRAYGHAFALFALTEHACSGGGQDAAGLALDTFELLDRSFRDRRHGGYMATRRLEHAHAPGIAQDKYGNDHIHLLEAIGSFRRIHQTDVVRDRLWETMLILARTVTRTAHPSARDHHSRDWRADSSDDLVSFGHDMETAWLLLESCDSIGVAPTLLLPWCIDLLGALRALGISSSDGSVYNRARVGRRAHDRNRIWWVQAEVLVGCLDLYVRTRSIPAGKMYLDLLQWIELHQADWKHGDWHHCITPSGAAEGPKAGEWRGPYHSARSMIECIERLDRLDARSDARSDANNLV